MIDPEVVAVLEAAPQFAARYRTLLRQADADPGAAATFAELADFVAVLLAGIERHRPALVDCLTGVEAVATCSPDAEDLVGWAFLDSLPPEERHRLTPWLGPNTRRILAVIEDDEP
jgi:hypothetical protein